jgi:effector-binding domain-containing protein
MPASPGIALRAEQPYVAIGGVVTMQTIGTIADRIPEVFGWLAARGVRPAGAPFLRYHRIDMARELRIEAGVPVAAPIATDDEVVAGTLPAGRYATLVHVGPFEGLVDATAALLGWAAGEGLRWDMRESDGTEHWGCRLESYRTNPAEEPDPGRWETELAFRLVDRD